MEDSDGERSDEDPSCAALGVSDVSSGSLQDNSQVERYSDAWDRYLRRRRRLKQQHSGGYRGVSQQEAEEMEFVTESESCNGVQHRGPEDSTGSRSQEEMEGGAGDTVLETSCEESSFIVEGSDKGNGSSSELSIDPVVWKKFKFLSSILKETQHNLRAMDDLILEHRRSNLPHPCTPALPPHHHPPPTTPQPQALEDGEAKTDEAKLEEILSLLHHLTHTLACYERHPLLASTLPAAGGSPEPQQPALPGDRPADHQRTWQDTAHDGQASTLPCPAPTAGPFLPLTGDRRQAEVWRPFFPTLHQSPEPQASPHFPSGNSSTDQWHLAAADREPAVIRPAAAGREPAVTRPAAAGREQAVIRPAGSLSHHQDLNTQDSINQTDSLLLNFPATPAEHPVAPAPHPYGGGGLEAQKLTENGSPHHPLMRETRSLRKDIDDIVLRKQALDQRLQSLIEHRAMEKAQEQVEDSKGRRQCKEKPRHKQSLVRSWSAEEVEGGGGAHRTRRAGRYKARSKSYEEAGLHHPHHLHEAYLSLIEEGEDSSLLLFPSLTMVADAGSSMGDEESEGGITELRHHEQDIPGLGDSGLSSEINSINATIQELVRENQRLHRFLQGLTCESLLKVDQEKLALEARIQSLNDENLSLKVTLHDNSDQAVSSGVNEENVQGAADKVPSCSKAVTFLVDVTDDEDNKETRVSESWADGQARIQQSPHHATSTTYHSSFHSHKQVNGDVEQNRPESLDNRKFVQDSSQAFIQSDAEHFLRAEIERLTLENAQLRELDAERYKQRVSQEPQTSDARGKSPEADVLGKVKASLLKCDENDQKGHQIGTKHSCDTETLQQMSDFPSGGESIQQPCTESSREVVMQSPSEQRRIERLIDENKRLQERLREEAAEREADNCRLEAQCVALSQHNQQLLHKLDEDNTLVSGAKTDTGCQTTLDLHGKEFYVLKNNEGYIDTEMKDSISVADVVSTRRRTPESGSVVDEVTRTQESCKVNIAVVSQHHPDTSSAVLHTTKVLDDEADDVAGRDQSVTDGGGVTRTSVVQLSCNSVPGTNALLDQQRDQDQDGSVSSYQEVKSVRREEPCSEGYVVSELTASGRSDEKPVTQESCFSPPATSVQQGVSSHLFSTPADKVSLQLQELLKENKVICSSINELKSSAKASETSLAVMQDIDRKVAASNHLVSAEYQKKLDKLAGANQDLLRAMQQQQERMDQLITHNTLLDKKLLKAQTRQTSVEEEEEEEQQGMEEEREEVSPKESRVRITKNLTKLSVVAGQMKERLSCGVTPSGKEALSIVLSPTPEQHYTDKKNTVLLTPQPAPEEASPYELYQVPPLRGLDGASARSEDARSEQRGLGHGEKSGEGRTEKEFSSNRVVVVQQEWLHPAAQHYTQLKEQESERRAVEERVVTEQVVALVAENHCLAARLEEVVEVSRSLTDRLTSTRQQLARVSAERDNLHAKVRSLEEGREESSGSVVSDSLGSSRLTQRLRDKIRSLQGEVERAWQESHQRAVERDTALAERDSLRHTSAITLDTATKEVEMLREQLASFKEAGNKQREGEREADRWEGELARLKQQHCTQLQAELSRTQHLQDQLHQAHNQLHTERQLRKELEEEQDEWRSRREESRPTVPLQQAGQHQCSQDTALATTVTRLKGQLHQEQLRTRLLEAADHESSARILLLQRTIRDTVQAHELLQAKYQQLRAAYRAKRTQQAQQRQVSQQYCSQVKELGRTSAALEDNLKVMLCSLGENIEVTVELLASHVFLTPCLVHPPGPPLHSDPHAWFAARLAQLRWLQTQLRQLCLHSWKTGDLPRTSNIDLTPGSPTRHPLPGTAAGQQNSYGKNLSHLSILNETQSYTAEKRSPEGEALNTTSSFFKSQPQAGRKHKPRSGSLAEAKEGASKSVESGEGKGRTHTMKSLTLSQMGILAATGSADGSLTTTEGLLTSQQQELSQARFKQYRTLIDNLRSELECPVPPSPSLPSSLTTTPEEKASLSDVPDVVEEGDDDGSVSPFSELSVLEVGPTLEGSGGLSSAVLTSESEEEDSSVAVPNTVPSSPQSAITDTPSKLQRKKEKKKHKIKDILDGTRTENTCSESRMPHIPGSLSPRSPAGGK